LEYLIARLFEVAALCAALYFVGFCYRSASIPKSVLKTLSVAVLAVAAAFAGAPIWLPLALAACATGDYYLSRTGEDAFLKGVGAFAIGHLLFMILFIADPRAELSRIFEAPRVAALSILIFMSVIILIWLWMKAGALRYAVAGYILIITLMGIAAATLPWQQYYSIVLLGVMFFILSDMILSMELFLLPESGWMRTIAPFAVWLFYWSAQLSITAGWVLRGMLI
jgi:uncharacterized membrane protein YhhN